MYRKSVKASPASASHVNSPRTKYARPSTARRRWRRGSISAPRREARTARRGRAGERAGERAARSVSPENPSGKLGKGGNRSPSWCEHPQRARDRLRQRPLPRPGPTMLRLDDPGQNGFGQRGPDRSGGGYVILTRMAKSHSFRIERSRTAARHNQYAATIDASDLCGRLLFVKDGAKGRSQTTRVGS